VYISLLYFNFLKVKTPTATIYSHYAGQSVLVGNPSEELENFVRTKFIAHMPLLTATSAFGLEKRCS